VDKAQLDKVTTVAEMFCVCLLTDSPGRDPHVVSTSSQRSQSAVGGIESGHKALVLKVHLFAYHTYSELFLNFFSSLAVRMWAVFVSFDCDLLILQLESNQVLFLAVNQLCHSSKE